MAVIRVVANIATSQMDAAKTFYGNVLGMSLGMDHGWIITFVGAGPSAPYSLFDNSPAEGRRGNFCSR